MRIIITGVAGFIGFHLAKKLISLGHKVTGIDDLNNYYEQDLKYKRVHKLSNKNFNFIHDDINNIHNIKGNYDLICNFAAQAGVRVKKSQIINYKNTNIDGFKNVISFCKDRSIKTVIYASSSSVYGDSASIPFKESETNIIPNSTYGNSKLDNELYAEINKKDLKLIGLRFFSVYGPYGRPDMAYFSFARSLLRNQRITLFNHGEMARDMTYIDDVIDGIFSSIKYGIAAKSGMHEIFNIGNSQPIKTIKMLDLISKELNKKPKIIFQKSINESKITHADLSKSNSVLRYTPKIKFNEGLKIFLSWLEEYEKK